MFGKWMSTTEAAKYLGVVPSQVRTYISKKVLPSKMEGGRRWVYLDDVKRLKEERSKRNRNDPRPIVLG